MVKIYSKGEIGKIAESGKILAEVLNKIAQEAKIGASLEYLDGLAFKFIKEAGAEPAFLGYRPDGANRPYGATICASINDAIVHGFPGDYKLKNGDILKIDCGVKYQGFYSDSAITIGIGNISKEAEFLIRTTKNALEEAINIAIIGNHLGDIGFTINKIVKKAGFKIVKGLTGHGIGLKLHEDPIIYNFGKKRQGLELKAGMVLAIEPMVSIGSDNIIQKPDESWATADKSLSAHFEHTVAVMKNRAEILTK
mgnify:FL=1